ncbi:hypothetical protein OBV_p-00080 (plasmid) [Oscillibacter valericigenes Sjm18-20]|nr:hypothetical protein OBV_p-00080 [Oscillibacter valericigenes Sjm18-20]
MNQIEKKIEKMELDKLCIIAFSSVSFLVVSMIIVACITLIQSLGLAQWLVISTKILAIIAFSVFFIRIIIITKNGIARINKDIEKMYESSDGSDSCK